MINIYQIVEKALVGKTGESSNILLKQFKSIDLYGDVVFDVEQRNDICSSFHFENESGTGNITMYHAFPGIELVYNDIHMEYCNKMQRIASDVVEINYCREGRCECSFDNQHYCYMSAGDMSIYSLQDNTHQSEFPTSHYQGITVTLDFSAVTEEMRKVLTLLSVNLDRIKDFFQMQSFYVFRANRTIEFIFSELYTVPEKIKPGYIRVKILELLLVLMELDLLEQREEHAHFQAAQIEIIKKVHEYLIKHWNQHHSIEFLAEHFEISPTVMKKCFKEVYGDSIYSFMKTYRLQIAEQLLKETTQTITEIANRIGYVNPNKFTSAFCAKYGVTPTEYRKEYGQ